MAYLLFWIAHLPIIQKFVLWVSQIWGLGPKNSTGAVCGAQEEIKNIEEQLATTPAHKPKRACLLRQLSHRLLHRYHHTGNIEDLHAAIGHLETAAAMSGICQTIRGDLSGDLGDRLNERFRLLDNPEDLNKAIDLMLASLDVTPVDHPRRTERLEKLSVMFRQRYELLEDLNDLQRAIQNLQEAVETLPIPVSDRNYPIMLENLSMLYDIRFKRLSLQTDLEISISFMDAAILAAPGNDPFLPIMLYNLSTSLLTRYEEMHEIQDLEGAIGHMRLSLPAIPPDHPIRVRLLETLSTSLEARYERLGERLDLENAVVHIREAIASTEATDYPGRAGRINNLSTILMTRYQAFGASCDLDSAIESINTAIETLSNSVDLSDLPSMLTNLIMFLHARYELASDPRDLDTAIEKATTAIEYIGEANTDHPDRPGVLANLGICLISRFEYTKELSHLDAAIENVKDALDGTPQGHHDRPRMLSNLAAFLNTRYSRCKVERDLDSAIMYAGEASKAIKTQEITKGITHNAHIDYTLQLCWLLRTRSQRPEFLGDLELAINSIESISQQMPVDHPNRPKVLQCLSRFIIERYNQHKSISDLEVAAAHIKECLEATPKGHTERASRLQQLSAILVARYSRLSVLADLQAAIKYTEEVLEIMPDQDSDRPSTSLHLSRLLRWQHRRLGVSYDLKKAVRLAQAVLESTPVDHPDYVKRLSILADSLHAQFDALGDLTDLESAIQHMHDCLNLTPVGHSQRAANLIDLGNMLRCKHRRLGALSDLEAAIQYAKKAMEETPMDDPDRLRIMNSLGSLQGSRYARLGSITDLDAAIQQCKASLQAIPNNSEARPMLLHDLGDHYLSQYQVSGATCDLSNAIGSLEEALAATAPDHPSRAWRLQSLGKCFHLRYESLNELSDLDAAIDHNHVSVGAIPLDHPSRAHNLICLGTDLRLRHSRLGSENDARRSFESFLAAWNCETAPPLVRVQAVWRASKFFPLYQSREQTSALLEEAVKMLPKISLRSLEQEDQQRLLSGLYGLSSLAASFALEAGRGAYEALKLLEIGRGIITGFAIDSRSEMSDLRETHPILFDLINNLRAEVNSPVESNSGDPAQEFTSTSKRRLALDQIEVTLEKIRNIPMYENFLLPPSPGDMMKLAKHGSIVAVITTSLRSDAIIVTGSDIRFINLPKLVYKQAKAKMREMMQKVKGPPKTMGPRNKAMKKILVWLWDVCVEPILNHLQLSSQSPRIWWMGIGELSRAPFHAAGYHTKLETRNTLSHVVSSYIPTLRSLSYASQRKLNIITQHNPRLLIVTMPTTPGHPSLLGATKEAEAIFKIVEKKVSHKIETQADISLENEILHTTLLDQPSTETVLKQLPQFDAVHFACHGVSDSSNPSNSSLLLLDKSNSDTGTIDRLTVRDISRSNSQNAQLAYLSACSTADNPAIELSDETIHLASGFQLAGFNHVLATLWQSKDEACKKVAETFYGSLFHREEDEEIDGHRKVSSSLHNAVRLVRDENIEKPLTWAPFIHTGA